MVKAVDQSRRLCAWHKSPLCVCWNPHSSWVGAPVLHISVGTWGSLFHVGVCCVASFFVLSLWIALFAIKGALYLFVVYLPLEKQVHDFSYLYLFVVSRTEPAHGGYSINTCTVSPFFICAYWYIPISPLSSCANHILINSPRCQSLGKWVGEVTDWWQSRAPVP